MADTGPQALSVCRFPGCDDPVHADGICFDHHRQFHADDTTEAPAPRDAQPTPAATADGRLRIAPMHAVVRTDGPSVVAVYGVYGTAELAGRAAGMLSGLGIPGEMDVFPFFEVTP